MENLLLVSINTKAGNAESWWKTCCWCPSTPKLTMQSAGGKPAAGVHQHQSWQCRELVENLLLVSINTKADNAESWWKTCCWCPSTPKLAMQRAGGKPAAGVHQHQSWQCRELVENLLLVSINTKAGNAESWWKTCCWCPSTPKLTMQRAGGKPAAGVHQHQS